MRFSSAVPEHDHSHTQNRLAVIPTSQRLQASTEFTGKGVTIAFLDSGFYPHEDLTQPENRIVAFHDVTNPKASLGNENPSSWDWHGTQTSVVAAGNGHLSGGIYRGLASEAALVLVKVSNRGRVSDENIVRGFDWVITNKDRYSIRVVSVSLGADEDVSYQESIVDAAAERAVQAGLVVVVAAGNSGCSHDPRPIPPANSPSVITVGGYNDNNQPDARETELYCSNYGPTIDGLLKPELIGPAMWVAAPIVPETDSYRRAEALSEILAAPDYQLPVLARKLAEKAGLSNSVYDVDTDELRAILESRLRDNKIIAAHYQHVDGTSFAAPIVASVVAQMIQARSELTPPVVKNILISTADRLAYQPLARQGYGVVNARRAVESAQSEQHTQVVCDLGPPRIEAGRLVFWLHHDSAERIALAGDFNGWNETKSYFVKQANGLWRVEIALPRPGRYRYKVMVNHEHWLDDPSNATKEPDGFGGFNSVVYVTE